MKRRNTAIAAAAFISAFAAVLALGQPQPPPRPSPRPEPASSDPLDLFTVMMPVFTHDRCANCHGAVDPFIEGPGPTGEEHEGGMVGSPTSPRPLRAALCSECHDSSQAIIDKWITPFRPMTFHDKDATALCKMQAAVVDHDGRDKYMQHLIDDPLITDAFTGQIGGIRVSMPASKPPMNRDDFLKAARAWLNLGAKCKPWTGSITQHETFASSYSFPLGGEGSPIRVTVNEQAQRILTVDRVDGVSSYRINQGGHQNMLTVIRDPSVPCETTITSNTRWEGRNQAPEPGGMHIWIRSDGSYAIRIAGPKEKTLTIDSGHASTNCPGPPPGPSADTTALDWNPWKTTIRCPATFQPDPASGNTIDCDLYDPKTNPRLKGTMTRTLRSHEDASDPASWLEVGPIGISRSDTGGQLPVTVVTTWDLTLPP